MRCDPQKNFIPSFPGSGIGQGRVNTLQNLVSDMMIHDHRENLLFPRTSSEPLVIVLSMLITQASLRFEPHSACLGQFIIMVTPSVTVMTFSACI